MAAITNTAITTRGLSALAFAKANEKAIAFTRMEIGDGFATGELEAQTSLINTKMDLPLTNIVRRNNNQVWVETAMTNNDVVEGFFYREIGLFCTDPETGDEILYCYGNAGDLAEFVVADGSTSAVSKTIRLVLNISNEQAATINMNDENHATNNYVDTQVANEKAERLAQISNCITEIPQDIKIELNAGVLTLKAGSKIYIPNGWEADGTTPKFDKKIIENDTILSANFLDNAQGYLYFGSDRTTLTTLWTGYSASGTTAPETSDYSLWYDAINNLIKFTRDGGTNWEVGCSLPIAIIFGIDKIIKSIDQIFNGFSYIGQTFFGLPGVTGLIPNGRNSDGTLKNQEVTTNRVSVHTLDDTNVRRRLLLRNTGEIGYGTNGFEEVDALPTENIINYRRYYLKRENQIYVYFEGSYKKEYVADFGEIATSAGTITFIKSRLPYRAVDYNDFYEEQTKLQTLIEEKDFEIDSLGKMIELDLTKLFIQIFEDTSSIDTTKGDGAYCMATYYDAARHIFIKNDTTTKTIYSVAKAVTNGNNKVWSAIDWANVSGGTVKLEASRDGGTNWTTLTAGALTDISTQPAGTSMVMRVTVTGRLRLKNIAWGFRV